MKHREACSIFLVLLVSFFFSCGGNKSVPGAKADDFDSIRAKDTLNVLTLYSSTSYFLYKGEEMGYEYELIRKFAQDHDLVLNMVIARNMSNMIDMLNRGEGDIIAYDVPITGDTKDVVMHCGQEMITHQVLVQPAGKGVKPVDNVVELVGKDVYVEKDSKYEDRINNLNDELGGGIRIHHIDKDSVVTEELIEMVADGKIPYTLADNNLARLNKTYYNNIDIHLKVSFPQRSSWAVRKNSHGLAGAVNEWVKENNKSDSYKAITKRYFELSKNLPHNAVLSFGKGQISVYDHLFKKYAGDIGWDWRLIASQAYNESHFDTTAVSWAGARGLMQLMPRTAAAFGVSPAEITNPEKNIKAAVRSMKVLDKSFSKISNPRERIKFILAAYNGGIGHVYDAMALAEKYGKNPYVWDGNVREFILLKSNPEYFNDEVCKFGYFKGRQTTTYVSEVLRYYDMYKQKIPY